MRKSVLLPLVAVLGGGVGLFLRRWELSSAFEPGTGLPIPGAPASWALIALSAVMAVVLLLLCRGKHSDFPGGYDQAFAAKGNTVYIAAMVLSALLLLVAGVLLLLDLPLAYQTAVATQGLSPVLAVLPKALLVVLTLGSFFSVLLLGKNNYRGEGKGKFSFPLLMPAYMACIWLISAYQDRAGDPIRLDYIYELFAIIAALLGCYFMAGFSFEKAKVTRATLFGLLGVYFSMVTLADAHDLPSLLLYGFMLLYLTAGTAALLFNDGVRMCASPATETELQTEVIPDEG